MSDIFDNEFDSNSRNDELEKALEAGYGTDASEYKNGRALQREDLEATLVSVLDVKQNDLKLFHKLHKQPVSSTVHQVVRQTGVGDDEFLFVGEGELASEDNGSFERKIYETKYISSEWKVSHPLTLTDTTDNPINAQKVSAVMRVSKGVERAFFHGNSEINPKQYDGFIKIIKDSANNKTVAEKNRATIFDLKGLELGEKSTELGINADIDLFNAIAEKVYSKGGDLSEAYFAPVVANQFWNIMQDRLRFNVNDGLIGFSQLPDIPTATGSTIRIKDDCGADKMFHVKGIVEACGDSSKRPFTPTSITGAVAESTDSEFSSGFAGNYTYAVHAVNAYGISAGVTVSSAIAVAAGNKVTLTITPNSDGPVATGFIITRTNKDGTQLMEMTRIKNTGAGTVEYVDVNKELPGTAQIVLLTANSSDTLSPNVSFAQLMGMSNYDLPTDSSIAHRGVVMTYGTLEVRVPEYCALIDNVGYKGGLY
jgi:hypothetical protein